MKGVINMSGFLDEGTRKIITIEVNDDKEQDTIANYIHEQVKNYDSIEVRNDIDRIVVIFYEGSEDVTITI